MTLKNKTSSPTTTPTQTQTPIPMHGDNFDFIGMVNNPTKELTLPLTDMECALIDNVFLYSYLVNCGSFTYDGKTYTVTKATQERNQMIFDLLVSIISQDEHAILKMDEFSRLKSLGRDTSQCHTQREVKK